VGLSQSPRSATPAAVATTAPFPPLDMLRIGLSIRSDEYTIWPGPPETYGDYIIGFPLELHPFAWDYLRIGSDAKKVTVQPHYRESSWDTFWIDLTGHVTCHALGGLFPWTLGKQPELVEGLRTTIAVLPAKVDDPAAAKALEEIAAILEAIELDLRSLPVDLLEEHNEAAREVHRQTARGRAAERFWERKRRRQLEPPGGPGDRAR